MTHTGPYMDNKRVCSVAYAYGYIKMPILIAARIDVQRPRFLLCSPPFWSPCEKLKSSFSFTLGSTWTCSLKASHDAPELMGFSRWLCWSSLASLRCYSKHLVVPLEHSRRPSSPLQSGAIEKRRNAPEDLRCRPDMRLLSPQGSLRRSSWE